MSKYITYIRVSTDKQFKNTKRENGEQAIHSYGIVEQRQAVKRLMKDDDIHVEEFIEIESGAKKRVELDKAIALCRATDSTLLIARLDRLYRNVAFTAALAESGIKFVCADMPLADRFTIHIMSAVAQKERDNISRNTKAALENCKRFGTRSGKPIGNKKIGTRDTGRKQAYWKQAWTLLNDPLYKTTCAYIRMLRRAKVKWVDVNTRLNEAGFRTKSGNEFKGSWARELYNNFYSPVLKERAAKWEEYTDQKRREIMEKVRREEVDYMYNN